MSFYIVLRTSLAFHGWVFIQMSFLSLLLLVFSLMVVDFILNSFFFSPSYGLGGKRRVHSCFCSHSNNIHWKLLWSSLVYDWLVFWSFSSLFFSLCRRQTPSSRRRTHRSSILWWWKKQLRSVRAVQSFNFYLWRGWLIFISAQYVASRSGCSISGDLGDALNDGTILCKCAFEESLVWHNILNVLFWS